MNASQKGRRRALVTGGARRLGRAIAKGLAGAGYDVFISYRSSPAEAQETVRQLAALGSASCAHQADLSRERATLGLAAAFAKRHRELDLLVNSASTFEKGSLLELSTGEWDRTMAVNARAPFLLVRELAPLLRAARGSVVNLADLSAYRPWPAFPAHSVSKAALLHLTRAMAASLAPLARANAVVPGLVLPPDDWSPEKVRRSAENVALRRPGTPDDIVQAVLYLASARYVTGSALAVDGGSVEGMSQPPE